jgi:hypothetical protein
LKLRFGSIGEGYGSVDQALLAMDEARMGRGLDVEAIKEVVFREVTMECGTEIAYERGVIELKGWRRA